MSVCVFRHIQDPASQRLTWNKPPKSVLVIKKIRDATLLEPFKELCIFLTEVRRVFADTWADRMFVSYSVHLNPQNVSTGAFASPFSFFCRCRWKTWLFTWKRRFWKTQPFQGMTTLGLLPRNSVPSEKVWRASVVRFAGVTVTNFALSEAL